MGVSRHVEHSEPVLKFHYSIAHLQQIFWDISMFFLNSYGWFYADRDSGHIQKLCRQFHNCFLTLIAHFKNITPVKNTFKHIFWNVYYQRRGHNITTQLWTWMLYLYMSKWPGNQALDPRSQNFICDTAIDIVTLLSNIIISSSSELHPNYPDVINNWVRSACAELKVQYLY